MLKTSAAIGGLLLSLLAACGGDRDLNVTAPDTGTPTTATDAELAELQATYESCELVPLIYQAVHDRQPEVAATYAFDLSALTGGTDLGDLARQLADALSAGKPFEDILLSVTAECPVDLWPQELPPVPEGVLDPPDHAQ